MTCQANSAIILAEVIWYLQLRFSGSKAEGGSHVQHVVGSAGFGSHLSRHRVHPVQQADTQGSDQAKPSLSFHLAFPSGAQCDDVHRNERSRGGSPDVRGNDRHDRRFLHRFIHWKTSVADSVGVARSHAVLTICLRVETHRRDTGQHGDCGRSGSIIHSLHLRSLRRPAARSSEGMVVLHIRVEYHLDQYFHLSWWAHPLHGDAGGDDRCASRGRSALSRKS